MKVTADTNILIRAIMGDHPDQSPIAQAALHNAELVALPLPVLCELVWVLARGYKISNSEIAGVIRQLIGSANVAVDRPATEAGLALLDAGGDFADSVIAFEGKRLGADTLLSFDRKVVKLITARGGSAQLPY